MLALNGVFQHDVALWRCRGSTREGSYSFELPILIKGRWEEMRMMVTLTGGEEVESVANVYLDRDVVLGDYLALILNETTQTNLQTSHPTPYSTKAAYQVTKFSRIPGLRDLSVERRAYLSG